jgi:hypothetical protein
MSKSRGSSIGAHVLSAYAYPLITVSSDDRVVTVISLSCAKHDVSIASTADNTPNIRSHDPLALCHNLDRRRHVATVVSIRHNGKLSCFFAGISTFLSFSIASARAIRRLVECGMITSSI